MSGLALVMPMAGRGSRFARDGVICPKPLIPLANRPFFWWAAESVRRAAPLREMVFVVLREHVDTHAIDAAIRHHYPQARIVAIDEPTAGAAETAAIGVAALAEGGPIAINDCDHAFTPADLPGLAAALAGGALDGALLGFRSADPAYSYARLDPIDQACVLAAVEKRVVGPYALAGCYFFAGRTLFDAALAGYRAACPYDEPFLSGMFDLLCQGGRSVGFQPLEAHHSFGTPAEAARVDPAELARLLAA